jgi:hypothetical protein
MRLRHPFDRSSDLPILGDLVRAKRNNATRRAVGLEAGVGAHVVLDVENYYGAKDDEIEKLLRWAGHNHQTCQAPPPIAHRAFGRPRKDGASEEPILEDILSWLAEGKPLSRYESVKLQVSSRRALTMVTRHLRTSNEFRVAYAQARAIGAHHLADQCIEIADDMSLDTSQANNMIKVRQWNAARHNPALFGSNSESNVNINIGLGDALQQLERRREKNALPAPQRLQVIDVEPLELQRADPTKEEDPALAIMSD